MYTIMNDIEAIYTKMLNTIGDTYFYVKRKPTWKINQIIHNLSFKDSSMENGATDCIFIQLKVEICFKKKNWQCEKLHSEVI